MHLLTGAATASNGGAATLAGSSFLPRHLRMPYPTVQELHKLLLEERLAGATLLILANKQDVAGALSPPEIEKV